MINPKPTDKGMVVYRKYYSQFDPEYITIFRGKVICSIDPAKNQCVAGGVRLKSRDELNRMMKLILDPIAEKFVSDSDYERHYLNGFNYKLAVNILKARN